MDAWANSLLGTLCKGSHNSHIRFSHGVSTWKHRCNWNYTASNPPTILNELIQTNLAKIEKRFGRATACRVVVRAPNAHHQSGAPFEVSIRIALPAKKEINVNHTPGQMTASRT